MSEEAVDIRRARWRLAQQKRREHMRSADKVLLRVWCSPAEAQRLKDLLRQWRRAERLKSLRSRNGTGHQ